MSFGTSIGDLVAITTLAVQVYNAIRDGPQAYRHLLDDVSTMRVILEQVEHFIRQNSLSKKQQESFTTLVAGCQADLLELRPLVEKYHTAAEVAGTAEGFGRFRNMFRRAKLAMVTTEDTSGLRSRMTLHAVALATLLGVHVSSKPGARLEFCDDEALMILLGSTGSGKSNFARLATGSKEVEVGHTLLSSTQSFQAWRFAHDGINYTVVDCPGFDDTHRQDFELILELAEYLEVTFRAQFLVSGIVYLHRIVDVRMTGSAVSQLQYVRKLCGTQSFKKVAFVTTFWDNANKDAAEFREKQLMEDFWSAEIEHGAITKRLDHGRTSVLEVLSELAGKPPVVLEVQRELVVEGKPFGETAVGQKFVYEMQESIRRFEKEAEQIKQLSKKDPEFARKLASHVEDIEQRLKIQRAELERLSTTRIPRV